jgi:hypothetical protein
LVEPAFLKANDFPGADKEAESTIQKRMRFFPEQRTRNRRLQLPSFTKRIWHLASMLNTNGRRTSTFVHLRLRVDFGSMSRVINLTTTKTAVPAPQRHGGLSSHNRWGLSTKNFLPGVATPATTVFGWFRPCLICRKYLVLQCFPQVD